MSTDHSAGSPERDVSAGQVVRRAGLTSEVSSGLIGLVGTLISAAVFHWNARDVVWGFWICSLTFGYAYIGVLMLGPFRRSEGTEWAIKWLVGFLIHFSFFHAVHAFFLHQYEPLLGKGVQLPNPLTLVTTAFAASWPLVLATFVARFSDLPFHIKMPSLQGDGARQLFLKPYGSVIRMHLLIFLLLGLVAVGWVDHAIYPMLVLYFFPWGAIMRPGESRLEP